MRREIPPFLVVLLTLLSAATASLPSEALSVRGHHRLKSKTFMSPAILLRPGSVSNKWYLDIVFPRGHIALKSFNAEVVDEHGAPPYFAAKDAAEARGLPTTIPARNSGVCARTLGQYYGPGSEARRTATWVPDPYAVEAGDPAAPPEGYEELWSLNVHAIDTRGAADRLGCTECRCCWLCPGTASLFFSHSPAQGRR
ncbi:hypothetical protein SETIT_6G227900v2 [Setaria italica]|uniref:Amine oxidase n=1 Tax=Setaria italica TaxID=4555 RepID=K3YLS9_SETIT|nr:hypothetical protein SETIT_6G227900v2 [Setaria italica]